MMLESVGVRGKRCESLEGVDLCLAMLQCTDAIVCGLVSFWCLPEWVRNACQMRKPTQLRGTAAFVLRGLEYLSQHDKMQEAQLG